MRFFLIHFILQPQIIRDHRDELTVRRLSTIVLNGVAEITVEGIHVASVPCDLNGVADSTLDRPLSTYNYANLRFLHMEGVRLDVNDDRCYQILLAGGEENMPLE